MHPKVSNVPKQISLLRSWFSFFCVGIYKDLAPPEPFFNILLVSCPINSVAFVAIKIGCWTSARGASRGACLACEAVVRRGTP